MEWLKKRLAEKSTLVGLVTIAATMYTGPHLAVVNELLPMILAAIGGGAVAATTKK